MGTVLLSGTGHGDGSPVRSSVHPFDQGDGSSGSIFYL